MSPDLRPALWAACAQLDGTPYVFGGRDVTRQGGLDCSGYVLECLHRVGIDLTSGQPYDTGKWVTNVERLAAQCTSPLTPEPGDLIIFQGTYDDEQGNPVEYSHVGIIREPRPVGSMQDCHDVKGAGLTDYKSAYWVDHYRSFCRVPGLFPEPVHTPDATASFWTTDQIAAATGAPADAVAANWPLLLAELVSRGVASRMSQAAAIATMTVETGSRFRPIKEFYDDPPGEYAYFEGKYGVGNHPMAWSMGNREVGDGAKYPGRGDIQLTWKANYQSYGDRLGVDLVGSPDLALDPHVAAQVFALYWVDHDLGRISDTGDWATVRSKVQGGQAGLDHLKAVIDHLLG